MPKEIDVNVVRMIDEVSNVVLRWMRDGKRVFGEKTVHQEFTKYPILDEYFTQACKEVGREGLTRNDLDIDVVAVLGLKESHHVHRHPIGHALASCLSASEGWQDPEDLHYIRKPGLTKHADIDESDWIPMVPGDRALFYPGVPHGLKGSGYILSVQSPSIEGHDERDDDWDLLK